MGLLQDTRDLAAIADKIRDDVQRYADGEKARAKEIWPRLDGMIRFAQAIKKQYKLKRKRAATKKVAKKK